MLRRNTTAAYAAAAIVVAAAIGVRLAAQDVFQGYAFLTLFPAVILASYVGGVGPGVLALGLGGLGAWYLLVPYQHSFAFGSLSDAIGLVGYIAAGAVMIWIVGALVASMDRERAARQQLAAAVEDKDRLLRERELLLTEIRHRVGNNLQQITGLLMLHARRIADPEALDAFNNAAARVNLFADVHRHLYRSPGDQVELREVLGKLATRLVAAHRPVGVACRVDVAPGFVWAADKAVPLVMVAHELVANAIEHAFGEDGTGTIAVALQRTSTGLVRLTVTDDGRGLPAGVDRSTPTAWA